MIEELKFFGNVFAQVRSEYVEEVSDEDLIAAALNGALHALDPHSSYVPPVTFEEQQVSSRREYGGLGIEVTQELGLVKVQYALEDGPAFKAGIRTGDYITAVEGEKVRGKSLDEAIKGMKGLAGDPVTVTVLNTNNITKDIVVVRQTVRGRAIQHRVRDGLGYVFIETFNNENLAAVVMGRRSFGKGSVQSVIPLIENGGALRLTTQRYYTPSGKSIQGRGIMPDILVASCPNSFDFICCGFSRYCGLYRVLRRCK